MSSCELCGASGKTVSARIEGSILQVCLRCSAFGQRVSGQQQRQLHSKRLPRNPISETESNQTIVGDYAARIKQAREKRDLTQEEFAKAINEKIGLVQRFENGLQEPPLHIARKLEKLLHIKLITEQQEKSAAPHYSGKSKGLTIADMLKK